MKKTYKIEVDCALCAQKIEEALRKVEGVSNCNVNFIMQKMILETSEEEKTTLARIKKTARKIEPDFQIIE